MHDLAMNRNKVVVLLQPNGDVVQSPVSVWTFRASVLGILALMVFSLIITYLLLFLAVGIATAQQPVPVQAAPQPVNLTMEDQFNRKADLADLRGHVVILVYGDKDAKDTCRQLGESLHVCWHPDAKGQQPKQAQAAPVIPLENLKPGQVSTNVVVVPVACCGKVPGLVHKLICNDIAKKSPDVVVWLDFADSMKGMFGLTPNQANLVVFDAVGRLQMKINGTPDQPKMDKLVKVVQDLRYDAVR
ncbi:MAG TPA: hypothetical protein VG097_08015 [Gemmata sp.]|jgi:hypothetical protein|nr:hypothetical protein [Gemmata sp.]